MPRSTTLHASSLRSVRPSVDLRSLSLRQRSRIIDEALRDFRIRHLREQIAQGTYETQTKIDMAVDRILQELQG